MPEEILSIALWEPLPDVETAALETFRELTSIVSSKGYGRDFLYRDREGHFVFLRYWKSEASRRNAQEDPDMLRCWSKLGNQIQIVKVYETLSKVPMETSK
jgi:hypothetical protein